MPQVSDDDVMTGVRTRWAAVPALNTLVPAARVYRDRAAESTPRPYAAVEVEEEDREYFSGSAFLAKYTVRVFVFTLAAAGDAAAIRQAVDTAFGGTLASPTAGLTVPNATVAHCLARPGGAVKPTAERVDGSDAVQVAAVFEVLVQGTR